MENYLQRIQVKGGIISPGELQKVITKAESIGLDEVHLGSRQDIIFPKTNAQAEVTDSHENFDLSMFVTAEEQNIMSSYVTIDIFPSTVWLRGTTYLYILEEFRRSPKLKINIVDPKQQMVPLFYGELNFIASSHEDYWFLYTKLPGLEQEYYPVLVYTWDIAHLSELIEDMYQDVNSIQDLFETLNKTTSLNHKVIKNKLTVDFTPFPYYEGMNKMHDNQYWLGLYWRDNRYNIIFLKALCNFCVEYRVGKICLTPWKSLIIKGFHKDYKLPLEKLLGQYGINVRHSALELNWHLPVDDKQALDLKKNLVLNFDQNDISTYGLTFAITSNQNRSNYFTSIVIEVNPIPEVDNSDFVIRPTFNVVYAKNFNPNTRSYVVYAQDIDKMDLPNLLMELTKNYFKNLGSESQVLEKPGSLNLEEEKVVLEVYQCNNCMTIYDPSVGDEASGVELGTFFEDLPADYCCSVCSSGLDSFSPTEMEFIEK